MLGWVIPPPKRSEKTVQQFMEERVERVKWLMREGFLKSQGVIKAMMKVPRGEFVLDEYRDYAYLEVPLPILSCEATPRAQLEVRKF